MRLVAALALALLVAAPTAIAPPRPVDVRWGEGTALYFLLGENGFSCSGVRVVMTVSPGTKGGWNMFTVEPTVGGPLGRPCNLALETEIVQCMRTYCRGSPARGYTWEHYGEDACGGYTKLHLGPLGAGSRLFLERKRCDPEQGGVAVVNISARLDF